MMENNEFEHEISSFYNELINSKKEYLQLFSKLQIQIEGWFRGELMKYFNDNVHELTNKNREVKIPDQEPGKRKKADFKIKINGNCCWIELKHLLIGNQINKSNSFKLDFYFKGYNLSSIVNDIDKLKSVKPDPAYILAFVSVNDSSITSKDDLETGLGDLLKEFNVSADKIEVDFDNDSRFGYFILKMKPNHNQTY